MKIKKFRAASFGQALTLVKKELGSDAVILSSEDRNDSNPFVEVTAAIDYDIENCNSTDSRRQFSVDDQPNFSQLQEELKSLKNCIESMKNSGFELTLHGEKKSIFRFLKAKSIKDEFALKLIERADAIDDVPSLISDDLHVSSPLDHRLLRTDEESSQREKKIIMLIGPTGVGKTTTVAKLASMAMRNRKKVALISFDSFKIGAAEQIRIYSKMIGIPMAIASNRESFIKSVERTTDRDIILVDTTGHNPRDTKYIANLKSIYDTGLPIETQLLLSTSSDCDFLIDSHKYYRPLPIHYMAFTKTDEAVNLGAIYNVSCLYKRPIAYITTGQRVPGNIEFIDRNKLTNLILTTGSA